MWVLWSHKLQQRCEIYSGLFSALQEDCTVCISKAQTSRWSSEHADTSKQAFLRLDFSFSAVCNRVKFENEFGYFDKRLAWKKTFHVHPSSGLLSYQILLLYCLPRSFFPSSALQNLIRASEISSSALWLPIKSSLHMLLDDTILYPAGGKHEAQISVAYVSLNSFSVLSSGHMLNKVDFPFC